MIHRYKTAVKQDLVILIILVLGALNAYSRGSQLSLYLAIAGLAYVGFALWRAKKLIAEIKNPTVLSNLIPVGWLIDHVEVVRSLIPDSFTAAEDIDYTYLIDRVNDISPMSLDMKQAVQFVTILSHTGLYEQKVSTSSGGMKVISFRSTDTPADELDMSLRVGPEEQDQISA